MILALWKPVQECLFQRAHIITCVSVGSFFSGKKPQGLSEHQAIHDRAYTRPLRIIADAETMKRSCQRLGYPIEENINSTLLNVALHSLNILFLFELKF